MTISHTEDRFLVLLGRIGSATAQLAAECCGVSTASLQKLSRAKYIGYTSVADRQQYQLIFTLSSRGRQYIWEKHGVEGTPYYQAGEQATKLARLYCRLPVDVQDTWCNGKEVLKRLYTQQPELAGTIKVMIDATVIIDGRLTGISVHKPGDKGLAEIKAHAARAIVGCVNIIYV